MKSLLALRVVLVMWISMFAVSSVSSFVMLVPSTSIQRDRLSKTTPCHNGCVLFRACSKADTAAAAAAHRWQLFSRKDDTKNPDNNDVVLVENLAQEQIAELIEVTFINACMQLAQGFVDVLKLFLVAVKASYERGSLTISELVDNVNQCPVQTAGRELLPEEVELRTVWIHAVHFMLQHIQHPTEKDQQQPWDIDENVQTTYTPVLPILVEMKDKGKELRTQEFVQEHADILPSEIRDDPVQMAIVSQTIKVLWYTLVVIAEEEVANDDVEAVPRPRIPRGTGFN